MTMTDSSLSKLLKARYWETVLNRIEENPQEAQENCKKKNTVLHFAIYQRAPAHLDYCHLARLSRSWTKSQLDG